MKQHKFPYTKFRITGPAQKKVAIVYRPVISIKLFRHNKVVTFDALIDSGADKRTFPGWIADRLDFNLYKGEKMIFSGIGGSVLAYLHKTNLRLKDIEFLIDIYYSHEWNNMPFGLLGQAGFFSHFDVNFNLKEKYVTLKSYQ